MLLDACVLYPAPLRDLLMHLAVGNLFQAKWTAVIHEEWMRNLLRDRPNLTLAQLERTRRLMDAHVLDALVSGFEHLIPTLTLPDADDRHVLAAAITANADLILTFNLADFPSDLLATFEIEAQHPDAFLSQILDAAPHAFCEAVKRQQTNLKKTEKTVGELLEVLEQQKLPKTVLALRRLVDLL